MWLRRSHRRCARCVSQRAYAQLLSTLQRCGVSSDGVLPREATQLADCAAFDPFAPLFTPYFHFNQHQLTTLGDVLVDDFLSSVLLSYCTHMGLVLTVNATRQLNAVLHNHFTMRLFAHELHFQEMAIPTTLHGLDDTVPSSLDFLEPQQTPPSRRDVAGTSFDVTPLASGQSPLGAKFSSFVAAVHQSLGRDAARTVLRHVYDLDTTNSGNVCGRAAALLLRVLERFPVANVAEAVLAAQGLAMRMIGKTRMLPPTTPSSTDAHDPSSSSDTDSTTTGLLQIGDGATLDELVAAAADSRRTPTPSLAWGPGAVDWVARWGEHVARHEHADVVRTEDGWLSETERAKYRDGPAFADRVDFAAVGTFADRYGMPHPEDGKCVRRLPFKTAVRDPRFYDTLSDMRNGIALDTDGEPLHAYLDRLHTPHARLFEVTMLAGGHEGRVVGRAIATRYTVAREAACRAYIGGVLNDLHDITRRHAQSTTGPEPTTST